jgi:hypothetical protein
MGVTVPSKTVFCNVLRRAVRQSMRCGYSKWALTAPEAKSLREYYEGMFATGLGHQAGNLVRGSRQGAGRGGVVRTRGDLREQAADRYRSMPQPPADGPWRTVLSAQEMESATYVQWRLQSKEVTFFPAKRAERDGTWID